MCGIVGYVGNQQALPFLLDGLQALEYRGYDSAGICIAGSDALYIHKVLGGVKELASNIAIAKAPGQAGIGHTRWATHGAPSVLNAHPHVDCTGRFAIVHNGVIENWEELKNDLTEKGHRIVSETDSELIAHLVEKYYRGSFESAVLETLALLEGAFGLLVMDMASKTIIAARRSSSLLVGFAEHATMFVSDRLAFENKADTFIYLDEDEIMVATPYTHVLKTMTGDVRRKKLEPLSFAIEKTRKGECKHFMQKEIFEQPQAVENTLRGRVKDGNVKLSLGVRTHNLQRILITACGTSYYSGLVGKYLIEKMARIPVEVDYASEFRYRNPIIGPNDLVLAISQSGETADTLAALQEACQKQAPSIGIVNVVGSAIARKVQGGIYLHAGPEIGVASTKAFTCQVTALVLLAAYLAQERNYELDIFSELRMIPEKITQVLQISEQVRSIAQEFKDHRNFLYLGRGLNFPVALEGALKLKEISYIHAEGYPAAEMKHGPIALVDKNMPVVFICSKDTTYQKIMSNMQEVKAREGVIIAVTDQDDSAIERLATHIIKVPKTLPCLCPIVNVIPLQLLAYHIADAKGLDVDRPRNLAKSVTVE